MRVTVSTRRRAKPARIPPASGRMNPSNMRISTKPGLDKGISVSTVILMKNQRRAKNGCPGSPPRRVLVMATVGWLLLVACGLQSLAAKPPEKVSYNRDIRPILSDKCFFCHGPDANKRKAKLRLDVREEAIKKEAFVPGKPDKSELIRRIFTTNTDDLMPPPESHKMLTPLQKELLRRWIAAGAEYQKHWAYLPPVKPPVPASQDGIDFLVQKRLKEAGLRPSPEADRRTLARRLYFDLIGLPPKRD